jgi:superfamily I DNA and/or RNA helicase
VESGIEFLRIGGLLSCAPEYREYVVSERMRACANIHEVAERVKATRVFVGTTASLNSQPSLFRLKHFTLAIVDEASQILEPHIIGLLSQRGDYGRDAIDKFVFIGDHKQLPAVVQQEAAESAVDDEDLNAIHLTDCRLSLFERLLRRYGDNPEVTYMLTRQGRMHRDIASFPNKFFYEGHLDVVPLPHQLKDLERHSRGDSNRLTCEILNTHRMSFIDVVPDEKSVSCKVNAAEARVIARLVKDIHAIEGAAFDTNKSVGVIIPYRNQIAAIRKELESFGVPALRDICIDTVERFQGSQRKYIIYGFTAQKEFQLAFLTENSFEENGHIIDRKLNVALTRAKEYNILVGNARLLRRERMFAQLIDYIRGKGAYFAEKG